MAPIDHSHGHLVSDEVTDDAPTEEHLEAMRTLYGAERPEECLSLATKLWARYADRADACLGECWRFAMIAATKLNRGGEAVVWRSRARSAFARTDCRNGTALAMLPDFFMATDAFPNEPEHALAILDSIAATVGGSDDPISSDMARGVVLEKRGFVLTRVGVDTRRRELLIAARADYDEALSLTGDLRRQLKIRAGRMSVDFLLATAAEQQQAVTIELQDLVAEAEGSDSAATEVARVGRENLRRMSSGRSDLEPYEVL